MFSKTRRFNYPEPESKEPPKSCSKYVKNHNTSRQRSTTSKINPQNSSTPNRSRIPEDLQRTLNQLEQMETRILNRCDTMDSICRDYLNSPSLSFDEGFMSLGTSPSLLLEEEEGATPAIERPLNFSEDFQFFAQVCARIVAEIVLKQLDERREKRRFWKRTRMFLARFNGTTGRLLVDVVRPRIVQGSIDN